MKVLPGSLPASTAWPWPVLPIDFGTLRATAAALVGLPYCMGQKIPGGISPAQAKVRCPNGVDCSGYCRYLVFQATHGRVALVDGSDNQHTQIRLAGFKPSTPEDATGHDGALRIAFLPPTHSEAGHVVLILDGRTFESFGAHDGHNDYRGGPGSRVWLTESWMRQCDVFCLTAPTVIHP